MRERDAKRRRQPVAEPGPTAAAVRTLGPPVPQPTRPALGGAVGEHPVLVADHVPDLGGEGRGRERRERALELGRGLPLRQQARVARREALGAPASVVRARIVLQPILDGREQRRQRHAGVGRDRQIHRHQRLERVRPAANGVVVERDGDHARVLVEEAHGARRSVHGAERAEQVGDIQREHNVGLGHHLLPRAGHVERMATRHARAAFGLAGEIDHRRGQTLGETAQHRRGLRPPAERLGDDQRSARLDQPARRLFEIARTRVRWRRGLKPPHVRYRHRCVERLLL